MQNCIFWMVAAILFFIVLLFIVAIQDNKNKERADELEQQVMVLVNRNQTLSRETRLARDEIRRSKEFNYKTAINNCYDYNRMATVIKVHTKIIELAKEIEGIKNAD